MVIIEVVRFLLDLGANVNASPTESGHTALMAAASSGHVEIVRLLLEARMQTRRRQTPATALDEAAKEGRTEVVRILEERKRE